jgi:hypothetical protein
MRRTSLMAFKGNIVWAASAVACLLIGSQFIVDAYTLDSVTASAGCTGHNNFSALGSDADEGVWKLANRKLGRTLLQQQDSSTLVALMLTLCNRT